MGEPCTTSVATEVAVSCTVSSRRMASTSVTTSDHTHGVVVMHYAMARGGGGPHAAPCDCQSIRVIVTYAASVAVAAERAIDPNH